MIRNGHNKSAARKSRGASPVIQSDISTIRSQPEFTRIRQLKEQIKRIMRDVQTIQQLKKESIEGCQSKIEAIESDKRNLKQSLQALTKQELLLKLQNNILAEQHDESNEQLMDTSRMIATLFERKREINAQKLELTKNLGRSVKDYERLCTNQRILVEHGKEADFKVQQLKTILETAKKNSQQIAQRTASLSGQLAESRNKLISLSNSNAKLKQRGSQQSEQLDLYQKDVQDVQDVDAYNQKSIEHYDFLIRTEGSKNQNKLHNLENLSIEEAMIARQLQSKQEAVSAEESVVLQLSDGLGILQALMLSAQQKANITHSSSLALSDQLIQLTQVELRILDGLSSGRTSRNELLRKYEGLLE